MGCERKQPAQKQPAQPTSGRVIFWHQMVQHGACNLMEPKGRRHRLDEEVMAAGWPARLRALPGTEPTAHCEQTPPSQCVPLSVRWIWVVLEGFGRRAIVFIITIVHTLAGILPTLGEASGISSDALRFAGAKATSKDPSK